MENIETYEDREKRIKADEDRLKSITRSLNKIYKDISKEKKPIAKNIIEEAAFYKLQIEKHKQDLIDNGSMEEMQQGAYTIKRENPAAKALRDVDAKYTKRLEMLGKLLDEEEKEEIKDSLDELIEG